MVGFVNEASLAIKAAHQFVTIGQYLSFIILTILYLKAQIRRLKIVIVLEDIVLPKSIH